MPYRPQLKTANGLVDFPLDAETVKGKTILEQTYPVGAIYISTNSTSPASLFGGTWQQIKDTFILAAGDTYTAGGTGGADTHTHGTNSLYAEFALNEASGGELALDAHLKGNVSISLNRSYNIHGLWDNFGPAGRTTQGSATTIAGSLDSANNMPPYLVAYVWKRTA